MRKLTIFETTQESLKCWPSEYFEFPEMNNVTSKDLSSCKIDKLEAVEFHGKMGVTYGDFIGAVRATSTSGNKS
jgi:hypothetical protein